jgi:hypothetical protein
MGSSTPSVRGERPSASGRRAACPPVPGSLVRNRVIAALSRGTVVVEAARRSGALNTARHARDQGRPLMAVPGPVTSMLSAGCHEIIRDWGAVCVTGARDVMEVLSFPGDEPPGRARGPVLPRDALDPVTRRCWRRSPPGRARAGQDRGGGGRRLRHGHALPRRARGGRFRRALRPWLADTRGPAGHDRASGPGCPAVASRAAHWVHGRSHAQPAPEPRGRACPPGRPGAAASARRRGLPADRPLPRTAAPAYPGRAGWVRTPPGGGARGCPPHTVRAYTGDVRSLLEQRGAERDPRRRMD